MKKTTFLLACILLAITLQAQPSPPQGLSSSEMKSWLRTEWYYPYHNTLGYQVAREKMYAYIDNNNNQIECVYSGYKQPHPFGLESTSVSPINCEHTVPQSRFGSIEPLQSDIHHLYPTYGTWNTQRSNYPYTDIIDSQTQLWIRNSTSQSNIPSSNIDEYSEYKAYVFEPREQHKGDVARSIFYMYTMYENVSSLESIDEVAFLTTLCDWHLADPPSTKELERNNRIANYQGNRNPYVDYPNIANTVFGCPLLSSNATPKEILATLSVSPNPVVDLAQISFDSPTFVEASLSVIDVLGKCVYKEKLNIQEGNNLFKIDVRFLSIGHYTVMIESDAWSTSKSFVK